LIFKQICVANLNRNWPFSIPIGAQQSLQDHFLLKGCFETVTDNLKLRP
jgi:hypothetical protein